MESDAVRMDGTESGEPDDGGDGPVESAAVEPKPLTLELPDGSESVSEAILSHREMLTNPAAHDLVSAEEMAELRETIEELSEAVPEELEAELATLDTVVDEMADRIDQQQREIRELRQTVASLADILGASPEFETAEDGDDASASGL